jgi:hypothetical protein
LIKPPLRFSVSLRQLAEKKCINYEVSLKKILPPLLLRRISPDGGEKASTNMEILLNEDGFAPIQGGSRAGSAADGIILR